MNDGLAQVPQFFFFCPNIQILNVLYRIKNCIDVQIISGVI